MFQILIKSLTFLILMFGMAQAQDFETFTVIKGGERIAYQPSDLEAQFTLTEITTHSTWTGNREITYKGVLLKSLIEGIEGDIRVNAYNEFYSDIPRDMIEEFNPILAFYADGKRMDAESNLGPLLIVWPRSAYPNELTDIWDGLWTWYAKEAVGLEE